MKDFLKNILATMIGVALIGIVAVLIGTASIVGMLASSGTTATVKDGSVLVMKLDGELNDHSTGDNPLSAYIGEESLPGLNELLDDIEKAQQNDKIKGIYLETSAVSCEPALAQELRQALETFRKSGKWIIAYSSTYSQMAYYIASVANKVYLNPSGMLDWHGLGSMKLYVKDLAKKLGVSIQVFKVGTYKSATEMFTEDHMSEADREQTSLYVTGIWDTMCADVSKSRGINVDKLNALADECIAFSDPARYKQEKLIDGLLYADQLKAEVRKALGLDEDADIPQLSLTDMQSVPFKNAGGHDQIAIYHAEGDIVEALPSGVNNVNKQFIVSRDVCRDLHELMDDDNVKAVVLRINSGGGSAYASEQMWRQIELLKKKKPVVVSMAGMAASGGYYMSCNANWIVADPTTITGSIGIFGMIPEGSELFTQKLGLHFDNTKTNRHATLGASMYGLPVEKFSAEEGASMQKYIERGYELFRKRVSDGRHLSVESVEEIAGGRVWLGKDAKRLKLVDQLGSLDDAVKKAAELAKTDDYHTCGYPAPEDFMNRLLKSAESGDMLSGKLKATLGNMYEPVMFIKDITEMDMMQARLPYYILWQ